MSKESLKDGAGLGGYAGGGELPSRTVREGSSPYSSPKTGKKLSLPVPAATSKPLSTEYSGRSYSCSGVFQSANHGH